MKQITTLQELSEAARDMHSCIGVHRFVKKPRPAAFIMNMQGSYILSIINKGLFIYEKENIGILVDAEFERRVNVDA